MLDQVVYVAAVTVLGVLEQAYFSLKVIYARRKYSIPPPATTGHPDFERVFRAQANCTEYFPLFVITLWVAGLYFSPELSWLNWCLTGSCLFSLLLILFFRESYDRLYLDVFVSV